MTKFRVTAGGLIALVAFAMLGQAATAGEWNKGHFNEPGGNIPAKYVAASECVFNGLDEPDESSHGAADGEETFETEPGSGIYEGDDGLWGMTPAGGRVQSGGQITATGAKMFGDPNALGVPTGIQGVACNPNGGEFH